MGAVHSEDFVILPYTVLIQIQSVTDRQTDEQINKQTPRLYVEAFEMQCYRRAMRISYVEHVMNEEVLRRVGQDRGLLRQVKSRKLKYFGHTTRHESLQKDIMLGIMAGKLRQGGQKKQWIDDIVQWGEKSLVEMVRQAENKKGYRCLVHEAAYARTSGTAS